MYILTERTVDDDAIFEDKKPIEAIELMVKATEYLIHPKKNDDYFDRWNDSHMQGKKNTIPLDLDGFEWLAKTVDNLILLT